MLFISATVLCHYVLTATVLQGNTDVCRLLFHCRATVYLVKENYIKFVKGHTYT